MRHCLLLLAVITAQASAQSLASMSASPDAPKPPVAARIEHVVKSPHGDRVDEYYWMRDDDPRAKRPEIMEHLRAENAYAEAMLAPLAGLRQQLLAELRGRIREDDSSPPQYNDGWWYWTEYVTGAEYPRVLRQRGGPEQPDRRAPREVVLDQPALAKGHPFFQVGSYAVSPDGRLLAWTEDNAGRRMHRLRFKDLGSGLVLADEVPGVLESIAWAADNRTLFYVRQDPVTLQSGPVYRHQLGTPAEADMKVFEEADKTLFVSVAETASRRYLRISVSGWDSSETLAVPTRHPTQPPRVVFARRPKVLHEADHLRGRWILRSNEGVPNYKLVQTPERDADDRERWRTLVPGRDDVRLEGFALFAGGIAVQERVQADARVRLLQGGRSVPGPSGAATAVTLGANPDARAHWVRVNVTSLVRPRTTIDWHLADGRQVTRKVQPVPGYDERRYATERFWAGARDGRQIPVTLAWRPDRAARDGRAPLLLTGYGAYGSPYDATFSSQRVSLLDRGFVFAIAHVRGGADLGEAWYEAGRLAHKSNTFNDFVDATRALVDAGWAARDQVFASGGSAGGLLMGAVANQAPDLYKGIVLDVPFVDALTTMLDETIPLTANEWSQWGDPREKAAYESILAYSPYDNLRAQAYPAMLVTTGLWDAQVQYFEPAKYVARLRARKTDRNPLLFAINLSAGHGGASGRFEVLAEYAREYAFLLDLAGRAR